MLNFVWMGMLIIGIIYGCFQGTLPEIGDALLKSGGEAVTFAISILGVTALWNGMLSVFDGAGGVRLFSKIISKPVRFLMPACKSNPEAEKQVITNITANFFGLGNGATPSGVAAVRELGTGVRPLYSMGMFLVINSAALQLMPTSVISILAAAGSSNPSAIIIPVWISSVAALLTGILVYIPIARSKK